MSSNSDTSPDTSLDNNTPRLTHTQQDGTLAMVDISQKVGSYRAATAEAVIYLRPETLQLVNESQISKGDVLACARIAGIQAAKQTGQLIPLCHPLALSHVSIEFSHHLLEKGQLPAAAIHILATCKISHATGVEMEALTAASVAALTLYDMCKGVDKHMVISHIKVLNKQGGKSGDWNAPSSFEQAHQQENI